MTLLPYLLILFENKKRNFLIYRKSVLFENKRYLQLLSLHINMAAADGTHNAYLQKR